MELPTNPKNLVRIRPCVEFIFLNFFKILFWGPHPTPASMGWNLALSRSTVDSCSWNFTTWVQRVAVARRKSCKTPNRTLSRMTRPRGRNSCLNEVAYNAGVEDDSGSSVPRPVVILAGTPVVPFWVLHRACWVHIMQPGMEICGTVFCTFARVNFLAESAPGKQEFTYKI